MELLQKWTELLQKWMTNDPQKWMKLIQNWMTNHSQKWRKLLQKWIPLNHSINIYNLIQKLLKNTKQLLCDVSECNQKMTKWICFPLILEGFEAIHSKSGCVSYSGVDGKV